MSATAAIMIRANKIEENAISHLKSPCHYLKYPN